MRPPAKAPLRPTSGPLLIKGMHGLGDNLHQRSLIRQLMKDHDIWLETSWPCVYHDMPNLKLLRRGTNLRTQIKNAAREKSLFTNQEPPRCQEMRVWYAPDDVRTKGSVLKAMAHTCSLEATDFRLPVLKEWTAKADAVLEKLKPNKPLLMVRPLVERVEWTGSSTRNPDFEAYWTLYEHIRSRYFTISVADLVPDVEWMVGKTLTADATFHRGELDTETLFGLWSKASLVYSAPGFATVMAQAVGTPSITVFGGYEDGRSFTSGAQFTPWLAIEPIHPCPCFSHRHQCDKRVDLEAAKQKLDRFLSQFELMCA